MRLKIFLGCGLWAGGLLAWVQAWDLSENAALLAQMAEQDIAPQDERGSVLVERIDTTEQQVVDLLSKMRPRNEATATGAHDRLRERARREGMQLTGAEGLGLIPRPLAEPAAVEALFNTIFDQQPVQVIGTSLDKTEPPAGHERLKISILCDSAGMGRIISALAEEGPWVLAGIRASVAPTTALPSLDGKSPGMAVELSILVDLQSQRGQLQ